MSLFDEAQSALSRIEARKIASTDQQLQYAQILALLAISEQLAGSADATGAETVSDR